MFETLTIGNEHETDLKADNTAEIEGKINECRTVHLMNLQTVDNTGLEHLLSHQEIPDAEQMTITNKLLEADNTAKGIKVIVGKIPDKLLMIINRIMHGNKQIEILSNGGTNKFTQEVIRKELDMLTSRKSRQIGREHHGDKIKDTLTNSTRNLATHSVGDNRLMDIGSIPNLNGLGRAYSIISHHISVFPTKDTFTGIHLTWDCESTTQAANRQNGFPSLCIRRFPQIGSRRRRIKQTDNR